MKSLWITKKAKGFYEMHGFNDHSAYGSNEKHGYDKKLMDPILTSKAQ